MNGVLLLKLIKFQKTLPSNSQQSGDLTVQNSTVIGMVLLFVGLVGFPPSGLVLVFISHCYLVLQFSRASLLWFFLLPWFLFLLCDCPPRSLLEPLHIYSPVLVFPMVRLSVYALCVLQLLFGFSILNKPLKIPVIVHKNRLKFNLLNRKQKYCWTGQH